MNRRFSPILFRGIAVWLLIILAETIHGIVRRVVLEPIVGDLLARQVSVVIGSVIILVIAFIFVRWLKGLGKLDFFVVGAIWVGLTIAFEIGIGRLAMDLTWERILSDYDLAKGGLMPLGLIVMLLAPLITAKVTDEI